MKTNLILRLCVMVMAIGSVFLLSSCEKDDAPVPVSGVTLSPTTVSVPVGGTYTLTATVLPDNAANKVVAWESDKTDIATVDANGKVTVVKAGEANITVTTEDGNKTATCVVTVTPIAVAGITLSQTSATLTTGGTLTLTATVNPPAATNQAVTWESDKTDIATVDANGKVTAVKAGAANIIVTTEDGNKTAACAVTVTQPATGVELDRTTALLNLGGTMTLTATVLPESATNKAVTWTSSNSAVATVTDGLVTALTEGSAIITATTQDGGQTATCVVTVASYQIAMATENNDEISIRMIGTGTVTINWGDGATQDYTLGNIITTISHDYSTAANYTIAITGENITYLDCNSNQLTSLDVSSNTALTELDCYFNQLTSLDVSKNTALTELDCFYNQLTSLDVSKNTALTDLVCRNNQLTSLDASSNTALTSLWCYSNQLTSLDVSGCTALTDLKCNLNQLTSLNVSGCTALIELDCGENQLKSLDVNGCTALIELDCGENQLKSLNVSGCTALIDLACPDNLLTSLNVSDCTMLTYLYCYHNQLAAAALNALFGTMHSNTIANGKHLNIVNNPGVSTCDRSIVTAKGWTVYYY